MSKNDSDDREKRKGQGPDWGAPGWQYGPGSPPYGPMPWPHPGWGQAPPGAYAWSGEHGAGPHGGGPAWGPPPWWFYGAPPPGAGHHEQAQGAGQSTAAGAIPGVPPHLQGLLRDDFTRGLLVGAAATFLLTNPKIQKGAISTLVQLWDTFQGGFAEMKERFHDAEAEMHGNADNGDPPEA